MKIVETYGLYHYEITGERENEAAADLEAGYERIMRDTHNPYAEQDISDFRRDMEKKYGVNINVVAG